MSKIGRQLKTEMSLKAPRLTEKATALAEQKTGPVYVFEVAKSATKPMVSQAFEAKYKIKPQKVRIINLPKGVKKAMVYLKVGEKIEIV